VRRGIEVGADFILTCNHAGVRVNSRADPVIIAAVHAPTFLADLALVLCVAAATSLLFRVLRQPAIVGYLLAGIVVGPYTSIPLFADPERIHALSEFGVVLVMFCVGLEFSIGRLFTVLPVSGLGALVQMSTLGFCGYALGQLFGWTAVESLFLAGALAISSTMVVAKLFGDRPPEPRLRELVFGILVVQDLVAIVLLAILSAVAAGSGVSAELLGHTLLSLAGFLGALLVGGLLVVPRLIRWVGKIGSPETVVVVASALCFGLAVLAAHSGYSVALGAFFAGMLAAESGRGHELEHLLTPLKDLFVAVFFVSVGMSVDPLVALDNLGLTLAVTLTVIVGQLLSVSLAGLASGNGLRRSVEAGLALGQIGEFAFIMAGIGLSAGIVSDSFGPVLVSVATLTSFTTPVLSRLAPRIAGRIDHLLPQRIRALLSLYEAWIEALHARPRHAGLLRPLVVLGLEIAALLGVAFTGALLSGRITAWLTGLGLSDTLARLGFATLSLLVWLPILIGIARATKVLARRIGEQLAPARAGGPDLADAPRRTFTLGLQLAVVLGVTAPIAMLTQPSLGAWTGLLVMLALAVLIPMLWRDAANLGGHLRASAEVVLAALGAGASTPAPEREGIDLDGLLPGLGHIEVVELVVGAPAIDRTLAELDVHAHTGANVLAVASQAGGQVRPGPGLQLHAGDRVVLLGAGVALQQARELLLGDQV
jgi:CPA2 family monovalent cation:H+ antiporter-2